MHGTFHQFQVCRGDSPSNNGVITTFWSLPVYQRQLSVCPWDLLSIFRIFVGPSVNFPSGRKTFRQLLSTFRASPGPSANFLYGRGTVYQLSARLPDLPSTSVNISCIRGTFHLLSVRPQNFHQTLSAFHVSVGTSKSSVWLLDLLSTSVIIPCSHGTFRQLSVHPQDIPSSSVNFPCIQRTTR